MKYTPAIPAAAVPSVPIRTVLSSPGSLTKSELKTTQKAFIANLRAQTPSSSKKPNGKVKAKLVVENEEKQNSDAMPDEMASFDMSVVPPPVCSCTGVSRKCYKSGPGWQSTCCTISLCVYPLPSSLTRPGKRVAGKKISEGKFRKVLHTLVKDGHDISHPVDLKNHWGKRRNNKFVTIN